MSGTQPGHEDFPEPAGMPLAHRHAASVPGVEIADQADPAGVRRPDRERDALDAVMHDGMRAELLIAGEMVAFDQQMDIEFAEHRRKPVDIVELVHMAAPRNAQPVTERRLAVRHAADEKARGVEALAAPGDLAARGTE